MENFLWAAFYSLVLAAVLALVSRFPSVAGAVDLGDLSLVAVVLALVMLCGSIVDVIMKDRSGLSTYKDRGVLVYGLTKSLLVLTYFGVVWLGFFAHSQDAIWVTNASGVGLGVVLVDTAVVVSYSVVLILVILVLGRIAASTRSTRLTAISALGVWLVLFLSTFVNVSSSVLRTASSTYNSRAGQLALDSETQSQIFSGSANPYNVKITLDGFDWHGTTPLGCADLFEEVGLFFWYLLFMLLVLTWLVACALYLSLAWLGERRGTSTGLVDSCRTLYAIQEVLVKFIILWGAVAATLIAFSCARGLYGV